jgi:NAD-dependent dihydropyrimidine dehydrogenase PreA subunit
MSISIDKKKCIGCSRCVNSCPGGLIYEDGDRKSYIKYPKDCWGCMGCVKSCPTGAISCYLGAEIGGRGGKMTAKDLKDRVIWNIEVDGDSTEIEIKRSESNKY